MVGALHRWRKCIGRKMAGLGVNVHGSKKVVGTANYFREKYGKLEKIVCDVDQGQELSDLADQVCESLHMPVWKTNPLFARTIACCRSTEKEN